MNSTPVFNGEEVVKAFQNAGWEVARRRSSHIILVKEGHIATLFVPDHKEVARGTLRSLVRKSGLTFDEFLSFLK